MRPAIKTIEANTDVSLIGKPSGEPKEYFSHVGIKSESSGRVNLLESEAGENVYANLRKYSKTVYIRNLDQANLSLKVELPVTLEFTGNVVTAVSYDLEEFGFGHDELEALKDLRESIINLYYLFKEESENLGPLPRRQWNFLENIIIEK